MKRSFVLLTLCFAAWQPLHAAVFKSTDGGRTWELVLGGEMVDVHSIAVDPGDTQTVFIGNHFQGVWKSEDGGASWAPTAGNGSFLEYVDDLKFHGSVLYAATTNLTSTGDVPGAGGIYRTLDGGDTWLPVGSLRNRSTAELTFYGSHLFAAVYGWGAERLLSPLTGTWNPIGGSNSYSVAAATNIQGPFIGFDCTTQNPVGRCGGVIRVHDDIFLEEDCLIDWTCWDPAWEGLPEVVDINVLASSGGNDLLAGTVDAGVYFLLGSWMEMGLAGHEIYDLAPEAAGNPLLATAHLGGDFEIYRRSNGQWVRSSSGIPTGVLVETPNSTLEPATVPYALGRDPSDPNVVFVGTWEPFAGAVENIFADGFESGDTLPWSSVRRTDAATVSNPIDPGLRRTLLGASELP